MPAELLPSVPARIVGNEDGSDEEGGHIVFAGDGVCILSIQVAHRSLRISTP